jgi:hypothetical protein
MRTYNESEMTLLSQLRDHLRLFVRGPEAQRQSLGGDKNEWERLAGTDPLLYRGLRDGVKRSDPEDRPVFDEIWSDLLASEHQIANYFASCPNVDAARLYRNACLLATTARAAVAACSSTADADAHTGFIRHWRNGLRVLNKPGPLEDALDAAVGSAWNATTLHTPEPLDRARELVLETYRNLPKTAESLQLREWTLYWLCNSVKGMRHLEIPLVGYGAEGGLLADFSLVRFDAGEGVIEHPELALQALDKDLLQAVQRAWKAEGSGCPAGWGIKARETRSPVKPLGGASMEASAFLGFRLLRNGGRYDSAWIVSASAHEDDRRLRSVAHERGKVIHLAGNVRNISDVVVAGDSDLLESELESWRAAGIHVHKLLDLHQAEEFVSGVASGLEKYYETLLQSPDAPINASPYLGGSKPTELYIWPDVQKDEPEKDRPRREEQEREERKSGRPPGAETTDMDESPYGEQYDPQKNVAWKTVLEELKGHQRWAGIIGAPGAGKSQLAGMSARHRAGEAIAALVSGTAVGGLVLPVSLSLSALTKDTWPEDRSREEAVRKRIAALIQRDNPVPQAVVEHLEKHVHEARVWLFLDALDEVTNEKALNPLWAVLQRWQCRVIVTSRPYGWVNGRKPPGIVPTHRLAPMTPQQSKDYVSRRFAVNGQRRVQMEQALLRGDVSVREMAQNGFLLALLCAVHERAPISGDLTRTELYEKAMGRLFAPESGDYDAGLLRFEEWCRLLSDFALDHFTNGNPRDYLDGPELRDRLRGIKWDRPLLEERTQDGLSDVGIGQFLVKELLHKRVLVRVNGSAQYAFPHRSILEFLAACALERKLHTDAWWRFVWHKGWDPVWAEVIKFLAGRLREDPDRFDRLLATISGL